MSGRLSLSIVTVGRRRPTKRRLCKVCGFLERWVCHEAVWSITIHPPLLELSTRGERRYVDIMY